MTYLDLLNEILAMTPEERNHEVELYENREMWGYEEVGKKITQVRKGWGANEILAVIE